MDLLRPEQLPDGFEYPSDFRKVVGLGLIDIVPWYIGVGDFLVQRNAGLRDRYPSRTLVPFAFRGDNDDTACWDLDRPHGTVVIVHDYASAGWESRGNRWFPDFRDWFRAAVDDMFDFD